MNRIACLAASACCLGLLFAGVPALGQSDPLTVWAVVTKVSKDRSHVTALVLDNGVTAESALIPADQILDNPVWRKLEICHALKMDAWKNADGYRIVGIRVLDAGMLPMALQGVAGDCLIKKALEFAPQVD